MTATKWMDGWGNGMVIITVFASMLQCDDDQTVLILSGRRRAHLNLASG